ncbi:MAG TPA: SNF2-related protein [Verrucomicrobiae bacterium]|jgi:superfamily II DNA or RNA helicase
MSVELDEKLFSEAAGWDVMKQARAYLAQGYVLSSHWAPPLLRGVVQGGGESFRASLVIHNRASIENLCNCRDSRQWGKICVHVVAVGLHWLKSQGGTIKTAAETPVPAKSPAKKVSDLRRADGGEAAELYLILPPNFDQAVARGKIMLVFEAKWSGGRSPLNVLPKNRAFTFSASENAIMDHVETLTRGETPAILQIEEVKDFASLLPLLAGFENLTLGKNHPVTVTKTPYQLPLRAALEVNGEIVLSLKDQTSSPILVGDWIWQKQTLQPLGLPPVARDIFRAPVRVPRAQIPSFLSQHWPQLLANGIETNFKLEDFTLEPQAPRFLLALKGGLTQLSALLQCAYGPRIMTAGVTAADENVWLPDPEVSTRYSTRDFSAESAARSRLQRSGFAAPDAQGKMQLTGQSAVLNFLAREFPKLQREWNVTLDEQLENRTLKNIERVEPQFQITSSGVQWFDLGVVFSASTGETFSQADIQRLILSGQNHTRLKNGKMAVIDTGAVEELQEVLLDCAPQQNATGYRINNVQAGFLEATLRQHGDWKVAAPSAWRDRAAKQSGEAKLACPPLGPLESVLRPYQKQGVAWLQFLRTNGFGGILADEMGLGKTLQTLAFLHSLRNGEWGMANASSLASNSNPQSAICNPHLIVCPTSLVFNWVAEVKKFTPHLKVLALHGPERHAKFAGIATSDIVVTSYALIRRDAEKYRGQEFDTVVLDEAQHIKNRQTQNAQAVKAVKSQHRLVLTGTPMENSVLDLWSIFDFLMPGYLGSAKDFRERYELPIAKEKNKEAQARLARRLKPFLLRRLKKEVAADLPAKLEQVSFCELTSEQRGVYQQVIEASRKEVLEATGEQGLAKSRIVVLTALLRLRQICCDLRLLQLADTKPAGASGKLELFGELLEEVIDGGHRALVFSQFTGMLALLKEKLTAEKIEFCYLDGSTTNRAAVVEKFQTNTTIPIFLISLKAGGVGLNLTGADTVIHFDPWWNPAAEDQATDRAHRIGQTKVVTSYKLITRDTVEEKILALQNRKREIIQATIGGEEEFAAALSWDEIQELLA